MLGLFSELGPVYLSDSGAVKKRNVTWCEEFACIFVDQPVGTGYSVARDYAKSEEAVASGLCDFLAKFFAMETHRLWRNNHFYIAGVIIVICKSRLDCDCLFTVVFVAGVVRRSLRPKPGLLHHRKPGKRNDGWSPAPCWDSNRRWIYRS